MTSVRNMRLVGELNCTTISVASLNGATFYSLEFFEVAKN